MIFLEKFFTLFNTSPKSPPHMRWCLGGGGITIVISLIINSMLISQTVSLPYDWSGQYGSMSLNGSRFWNRDWTSGPLMFDGTFTHYPVRFGTHVNSQFQPSMIDKINVLSTPLEDTTQTTTTLDYVRGDYNFDQLGIDLDYKTPKRSSGIHLFKRSYAGREGQFFHPTGSSLPLQQSYVLDYLSENNGWIAEASAGRFVTESGLPDSGVINGSLDDEILAAGLIVRSPDKGLQWTSHLALFHQWRKADVSWYSNRQKQFLNRTRFHQQVSGFSVGKIYPTIGLDLNLQSISKNDSSFVERSWSTFYSSADLFGSMPTTVGLTLIEEKAFPYLKVTKTIQLGILDLDAGFEQETSPTHKIIMNDENDHMDYRRTFFNLCIIRNNGEISLVDQSTTLTFNENIYSSSQTGLTYALSLYDKLEFKGHYLLRSGHSLLFDGIGTSILFDASYSGQFNRFDMSLHFSANGMLGRSNDFQFHPIDGYPFEYYLYLDEPDDIWLLNASAEVTISSMTIIWSIKNILHAIEPTSLQLFPEKEEGDFLIQHYTQFPPMGRIVTIGILWTFDS